MAIRANGINTPVSRVDSAKPGNGGGTAQSTSARGAAGAARASVPINVVKAEGGPPAVDFEQAGKINQAVERMGQMSNELSSAKAALGTGGQAGTITDAFGNEISVNNRSHGVARLSCMGDSTTDTWEDGHVADWRNRTTSDSGHTLDIAGSSRGQNPGSPLGRVMNTEETGPAEGQGGTGAAGSSDANASEKSWFDKVGDWLLNPFNTSVGGSVVGGAGAKTAVGNGAGIVGGTSVTILTANLDCKEDEANGLLTIARMWFGKWWHPKAGEIFSKTDGMDDVQRANPMDDCRGTPEYAGARRKRSAIEGGNGAEVHPSQQYEAVDPTQVMRDRLDPLIQTTGEDAGGEHEDEVELTDQSNRVKQPIPDATGSVATEGAARVFDFHTTHDNPGPGDPRA